MSIRKRLKQAERRAKALAERVAEARKPLTEEQVHAYIFEQFRWGEVRFEGRRIVGHPGRETASGKEAYEDACRAASALDNAFQKWDSFRAGLCYLLLTDSEIRDALAMCRAGWIIEDTENWAHRYQPRPGPFRDLHHWETKGLMVIPEVESRGLESVYGGWKVSEPLAGDLNLAIREWAEQEGRGREWAYSLTFAQGVQWLQERLEELQHEHQEQA